MKKLWPLWLITLLLAGCGGGGNNTEAVAKDKRIVSISKQLTEMLFTLGKGHDIVARDLTSNYPDSAKLLPTVGYHRLLNAEGIISMNSGVVIHCNDVGPETVLPQLEKAGLNVKAFGGANTYDSAKILLADLGKYFHLEATADSITRAMDAGMAQVYAAASNFKDSPTVMVIHYGQANNNFFIMSGRKGAADKMIALAGARPALYDGKGARQISAEAVAMANPDIIIATDFGFDKMGGAEKIKELPGVALTSAAKNNRIYRFEEHDLVYFGPRTSGNVMKLINLFHPAKDATKK